MRIGGEIRIEFGGGLPVKIEIKSLKTKVYATAYNELTGTVESKKNCALLQIQEEQMLESVCKTSYKIVQGKINMAYELLNSLKKVLNIRIAELELSRVNRGEV